MRKALVASCAIGSADRSVERDGKKVRPAMQHTGKAPTPGVCELDHGDIDVALLEDAIFRQQPLDVVADLEEGSQNAQMSSRSFGGKSWCTPPTRK